MDYGDRLTANVASENVVTPSRPDRDCLYSAFRPQWGGLEGGDEKGQFFLPWTLSGGCTAINIYFKNVLK